MTRAPIVAVPALMLAGCGSGANVPQTAAGNSAAADDYVAQVRALPAGQRDGVLLRAIRDAGRDCQQVVKSEAIPDVAGAPAWAATCDNRGVWIVALNPGGVATVTSAADVARAGGN